MKLNFLHIVVAAWLGASASAHAQSTKGFFDWCRDTQAEPNARHTTLQVMSSLGFSYDVENPEESCRQAAQLAQLRTGLYLVNANIRDLSPITALSHLESLHLSFNQIDNLAPLTSLRELRVLDVERNQIRDLAPLQELPKLEFLNISDNPIDDLAQVRDLDQVQVIEMRNVTERTSAVAATSAQRKTPSSYPTSATASPRIEIPVYYGYYGYCGYYIGGYHCPFWPHYYYHRPTHVVGTIITGAVIYSTLNWMFP